MQKAPKISIFVLVTSLTVSIKFHLLIVRETSYDFKVFVLHHHDYFLKVLWDVTCCAAVYLSGTLLPKLKVKLTLNKAHRESCQGWMMSSQVRWPFQRESWMPRMKVYQQQEGNGTPSSQVITKSWRKVWSEVAKRLDKVSTIVILLRLNLSLRFSNLKEFVAQKTKATRPVQSPTSDHIAERRIQLRTRVWM